MLYRFLCLFGHHTRGGPLSQPGLHYRSTCRGCGRPIVRRTGERWRIDRTHSVHSVH